MIVLFASCQKENTEAHKEKQVLRYWEQEAIRTLDPLYAQSDSEKRLTAQLYNSLFALDENMELHPELVEDFEIAEDSLSYVFSLKKGVFFHQDKAFGSDSSRELRAKDVVFSLNRLQKNRATVHLSRYFLQDSLAKRQADTALQVLDDYRFKIQLDTRTPHFLQVLTLPQTYIISKVAYKTYKKNYARHPVGTGAFWLKQEERNHFLKLSKHTDYFKKDLPYLDEVQVSWDYTPNSALSAFKHESLDVIFTDFYTKDKLPSNIYFDRFHTCYLDLSLDSVTSPFFYEKARQTLFYQTDFQGLSDTLLGKWGTKATEGFIPDKLPTFVEQHFKTERDRADSSFAFSLSIDKRDTAIASFLQKSWERKGIEARVTFRNNKTTNARLCHIEGKYADANLFLEKLDTGKSLLYDSLLQIARFENDLTAQQLLQQQLEQLLENEQLILPLFYKHSSLQKQAAILDLQILPTGKLLLEHTKRAEK